MDTRSLPNLLQALDLADVNLVSGKDANSENYGFESQNTWQKNIPKSFENWIVQDTELPFRKSQREGT